MRNSLFILYLIIGIQLSAQEVSISELPDTISIDKWYAVDFKFNDVHDSVKAPILNVYHNSPKINTSYSSHNGKSVSSSVHSYAFIPLDTGRLKLVSSTFYFKGEPYQSEKTVYVTGRHLSKKVLDAHKEYYATLSSLGQTPSKRIVVRGNKASLEVYKEEKWHYLRMLTEKEFKSILKIE